MLVTPLDGATGPRKKFDVIFSRLDIHEGDRQTGDRKDHAYERRAVKMKFTYRLRIIIYTLT